MIDYGEEKDELVRAICPIYAHSMWGKSQASDLNAGQKRQTRKFAMDLAKQLRKLGLAQ